MKLTNLWNKITFPQMKPLLYGLYLVLVCIIFYHLNFSQRIIPGVFVGNIRIGGLTYKQAVSALEEKQKSLPKEIGLTHKGAVYKLNVEDIGLVYDWDSTVTRSFEVGRTGNVIQDTKDKLAGLFKHLNIPAHYDYNDDALSLFFSQVKAEVNLDATNAFFIYKDDKVEVSPSIAGQKIVDDGLYRIVINSFDHLEYETYPLPVKTIVPRMTEADLNTLLPKVSSSVGRKLTVKSDKKEWVLDAQQLLNMISYDKKTTLDLALNEPVFEAFLETLAQEANELPRGHVIEGDKGKVSEFKITQEGREIDVKQFTKNFKNVLFSGKESVDLTYLTVADEGKDRYGIKELLGEGTSHFKGSASSRIKNLTLAANRTNGVLVAPGAVYSLNNSIGEISAATGYDSAYIIKEGRTVLGEGGGVCQTSTTLFRAVLNSGLPVVKRYPHAYRVSYYEQDSKPGFDAAIFQPTWDFQFKNDTEHYVLVQSQANLEDYSLTFKLYGTSDGRKVEISDVIVTNETPPPPALYQDDPTLPKGVTLQVDFSSWGATSKFTRTVKKEGTVLFEETFVSKYTPWRAVFLVGTK